MHLLVPDVTGVYCRHTFERVGPFAHHINSKHFLFSEPSQRPTIQDAGNRRVKADLSGRGSAAPLYQRVVRPD